MRQLQAPKLERTPDDENMRPIRKGGVICLGAPTPQRRINAVRCTEKTKIFVALKALIGAFGARLGAEALSRRMERRGELIGGRRGNDDYKSLEDL